MGNIHTAGLSICLYLIFLELHSFFKKNKNKEKILGKTARQMSSATDLEKVKQQGRKTAINPVRGPVRLDCRVAERENETPSLPCCSQSCEGCRTFITPLFSAVFLDVTEGLDIFLSKDSEEPVHLFQTSLIKQKM